MSGTSMIGTVFVVGMISSACAFGCSSNKVEPKSTANAPGAPSTAMQQHPDLPQQAPESPTAAAVKISDEIVKACGISEPDAYFAFDSSHLGPNSTKVLDQVAACFTTGALKGKSMKLVGRADIRGTEEYNITLGQSRADAVRGYLESRGVAKANASSTSRGAMDAVGTDEPSWARDRRVDVLLNQD